MRYIVFFDWRNLGHILRLRGFQVQERYENADLNHVHELLVKRLGDQILETKTFVVENFDLVLFDQK